VCIDRLLMTNLNIILIKEPQLRVFIALVLALGNVKMYSQLDPYIDDTDDIFAEVSTWSTVAITVFSIILQCGAVNSATSGTGLILVILLASVMILFCVFCVKTVASELAELTVQIRKLTFLNTSRFNEEKNEKECELILVAMEDPKDIIESSSSKNAEGSDITASIKAKFEPELTIDTQPVVSQSIVTPTDEIKAQEGGDNNDNPDSLIGHSQRRIDKGESTQVDGKKGTKNDSSDTVIDMSGKEHDVTALRKAVSTNLAEPEDEAKSESFEDTVNNSDISDSDHANLVNTKNPSFEGLNIQSDVLGLSEVGSLFRRL